MGIRIYHTAYLPKLLKAKLSEYGVGVPWDLIAGRVTEMAVDLGAIGYRVAWAMDAANRGAMQSAFLMGNGLSVGICATKEGERIKWEPGVSEKIDIITPGKARKILKETGKLPEMAFDTMNTLIDRLYQDHLCFVWLTEGNRVVLSDWFTAEDDDRVDVRVRLKV